MSRRTLAAAFSVVLTTLMMPSVHALDRAYGPNFTPAAPPALTPPAQLYGNLPANRPTQARPNYIRQASNPVGPDMAPAPIDANLAQGSASPSSGGPIQQQGYVRLGAPMYPTPRPNIPVWTGSTMVTNQAFAPQEMLYPHTYRAIYPPFYHRVKGGWIVTPLGVRSHEKWELQGTMVQVKYRSAYPGLLSGAPWIPTIAPHESSRWR